MTKKRINQKNKQNGIFYTPNFLADYLNKKIINSLTFKKGESLTVLDPACGDGVLLRSFNVLARKKRFRFVGIDRDYDALSKFKSYYSDELSNLDLYCLDSLFPEHNYDPTNSWNNFREKNNGGKKYDIIISNPPWGASLKVYQKNILKKYFTVANGQFDIYDLFVESIINNLNAGGIYGIILPDSIFNKEHYRTRDLLVNKTSIKLIARLGEKIFPQINRACTVIIGIKKNPTKNSIITSFNLSTNFKNRILNNEIELMDVEKKMSHSIPQQRFQKNSNYLFDINLRENEISLLKKITSSNLTFKDFTDSSRGTEISKKGKIYKCNNCGLYMPFPKKDKPRCIHCFELIKIERNNIDTMIQFFNGNKELKFKSGEDIYRYISKTKSWININKKGINYKNLSLYKGNKILVRKTGIGITAAIDYDNSVTNQVVYILRQKPIYKKSIPLEFILAVLNSRILTYFLLKKYGDTEWKSHPYLTQEILSSLPFPNIDLNEDTNKLFNDITKIVKKAATNSKKENIDTEDDLYIEKQISKLFNFSPNDYKFIFTTLKNAQQLIPIKRLLNFDFKEIA